MKNIGIIGGGAAGLVASIVAANNNNKVTILEHKDRVGKKLLLTGSGKCNISNLDMDISHFHSSLDKKITDAFMHNIFSKCSPKDVLNFLESLGIYLKDRNGYLYPYSEMASAVLDSLRFAAVDSNVSIITDINVTKIIKSTRNHNEYKVVTDSREYFFDKVIICCGSKAYEKTGSDGSGYILAKDLGENIIKPLPALTYFVCKENIYNSLAGIRTKAKVSLFSENNELLASDTGELQINKTGISGIPVFNISHNASKALDERKSVYTLIDFMPDLSEQNIFELIKNKISRFPNRRLDELFIGILHKNIGMVLIKDCNLKPSDTVKSINNSIISKLAHLIKNYKTVVTSTGGFDNSQVVCGGIDIKCLDENMQSLKNPGIYYAGEIIDINGDCGGYNLHFAFSTAIIAASDL